MFLLSSSKPPQFTTHSFYTSLTHPHTLLNCNFSPKLPMSTTRALSFLRFLSASLHPRRRPFSTLSAVRHPPSPLSLRLLLSFTSPRRRLPPLPPLPSAATTPIQHAAAYDFEQAEEKPKGERAKENADEKWDFSTIGEESESFNFDKSFEPTPLKRPESSSGVEVMELEELPEQWRRSKLAWLCKELPAHKPATLIRVLNAQRKWLRQEDATYIAVHCMRIRENETAFRVYKWMIQQHWFRFDFALATKLADYMGKERKFLKCREIFDDIINQGRVPSESTFHILTVAYLSSSAQGCLDEAFNIYSRMIQLGGYRPQLSLHNSVFRALVSKPAGLCKNYLKQAEFIFHNLETSGLEIDEGIYGGLIWLHSYQDVIDNERIASLRAEMHSKGIQEGKDVLVSVLRACSKERDIEEAEKTWMKLLNSGNSPSPQAFVYRMELYARIGQPMKSLEIFRDMQERLCSTSVVAYHKIIEVLSKAQKTELAESLMAEFINSGMKPLMPSFIDLMDMYLNLSLHDKLEATFLRCLEKCPPNRTIYNMYLDSLVQTGNLDKAEEIFNQMHRNEAFGVNTRSCNLILRGYLSKGEYVKAEKVYDLMCQKKYDIEAPIMEKLEYVLSLSRKVVKKPISLKLSKEQREILMGMLLGGLRIASDEERRNHAIHFEFNETTGVHTILKKHIHDHYHEWLAASSKMANGDGGIPYQFSTISHSYFSFYADQFWPNSQPVIPKLIHRWLSPRVLAYWYMYGGYRTSSGDIVLKVKGSKEGVERIVKTLKAKSLDSRVKRKGRAYWIGLLESNATWFWKLVEPFILDDLKDLLEAGGTSTDDFGESQKINFDSGSETDERSCDYSDNDSSQDTL